MLYPKKINRDELRRISSMQLDKIKVDAVTSQFQRTLKKLNQKRVLYALTITPTLRYIKDNIDQLGEWQDTRDDKRERFVMGLYNRLLHRVSAAIHPNYKRPSHKEKTFYSFVCIEHKRTTSKGRGTTLPHIHATISVHPDWNDQFLSFFQQIENFNERTYYTLPDDFFIGRGMDELKQQIRSIRLTSYEDKNWFSYSTENLTMNYQGTGVFLVGDPLCV